MRSKHVINHLAFTASVLSVALPCITQHTACETESTRWCRLMKGTPVWYLKLESGLTLHVISSLPSWLLLLLLPPLRTADLTFICEYLLAGRAALEAEKNLFQSHYELRFNEKEVVWEDVANLVWSHVKSSLRSSKPTEFKLAKVKVSLVPSKSRIRSWKDKFKNPSPCKHLM